MSAIPHAEFGSSSSNFSFLDKFGYVVCKGISKVARDSGWADHPVSITDAFHELSAGNNIALHLGASGLVSIDIDNPDKFSLIAEFLSLKFDGLYPAIRTGKGLRYYFADPSGLEYRALKGVFELRTGRRYDLIPPSKYPDKDKPDYEWLAEFDNFKTIPAIPQKLLTVWSEWHNFEPQMKAVLGMVEEPIHDAPKPARAKQTVSSGESVIDAFNSQNPIESQLERYGYKHYPRLKRWLHPHSTSGLPGVSLLGNGKAYSHHACDPLCGKVFDSFDLLVQFEFGGDFSRAVKELAPKPEPQKPPQKATDGTKQPQKKYTLTPGRKPLDHELSDYYRDNFDLWYNQFSDEMMIGNKPISNDFLINQTVELSRICLKSIPIGIVDQAISNACNLNSRNPAQDWIKNLPKWDGVKRFGIMAEWSTTPLADYLFLKLHTSIIARVLMPGCQMDNMYILEGAQGIRKSSLFRAIGGEWYRSVGTNHESEDWKLLIQGCMIAELPEMSSVRKGDIQKFKELVTVLEDVYRPKYARKAITRPRQVVLAGTINDPEWLDDPSGARRFIQIHIEKQIDTDWYKSNREQIFAEALADFNSGEQYWIPAEITGENPQIYDAREDKIIQLGHRQSEWKMLDILVELGYPPDRHSRALQMEIAGLLKKRQWKKNHTREGNVWTKGLI